MKVKLTAAQKIKIANATDIYSIMQQVLLRESRIGRAQEHYWIIGLNNASKILFIELLALGQANRVATNPAEAFRMAIYKLATQVIFVHNHPSGVVIPSKPDIDHTDYLYKAGHFLNINVLDHLVISETEYRSFEMLGLMKEIKESGAWELLDRASSDLKALETEIAKNKALRAQKREIASSLKKKGVSEAVIKETTGLRITEIKKL